MTRKKRSSFGGFMMQYHDSISRSFSVDGTGPINATRLAAFERQGGALMTPATAVYAELDDCASSRRGCLGTWLRMARGKEVTVGCTCEVLDEPRRIEPGFLEPIGG